MDVQLHSVLASILSLHSFVSWQAARFWTWCLCSLSMVALTGLPMMTDRQPETSSRQDTVALRHLLTVPINNPTMTH